MAGPVLQHMIPPPSGFIAGPTDDLVAAVRHVVGMRTAWARTRKLCDVRGPEGIIVTLAERLS